MLVCIRLPSPKETLENALPLLLHYHPKISNFYTKALSELISIGRYVIIKSEPRVSSVIKIYDSLLDDLGNLALVWSGMPTFVSASQPPDWNMHVAEGYTA